MNKSHKKDQNSLDFKIMSFFFKVRDFFKNPKEIIENINLKNGDFVLEYGCGPGSFTIPIAKKVGDSGKVYAADIHPLALKEINEKKVRSQQNNIETILTDCKTTLGNDSIDKVILIDVLHDLNNYNENMTEFYRILKTNGTLWVDDHHYDEQEITNRVLENHLFIYIGKNESLYEFQKKSQA